VVDKQNDFIYYFYKIGDSPPQEGSFNIGDSPPEEEVGSFNIKRLRSLFL
jgi:hypothetical protein